MEKSLFEQMGGTYKQVGDFLLPDIELPEEKRIGVWGTRHYHHLRKAMGTRGYTPGKCPKYGIHADPVWYCQTCHKLCGDGRNGTCVQFVIDCACPNCGEQVKAWTCHYCG